ncbi:MAG TPA: thiamine pyrophosphate-dependent enzyme [Opitutus sp.]|nr:thiamine pyrophosphate-dependent enzyme [Opitutus sp.]
MKPPNTTEPPPELSGAEILRTLLERQGIRTVAGIPGGAILPFYDALHDPGFYRKLRNTDFASGLAADASPPGRGITHVLARHEQGAGFIAQGMARVTGRAAVCLATSGPGATNLLTAIADARLDSIPLVAITAQVPQSLIGTDAFQEVDTYGLTLPITKHNFLVRSVGELLATIPLAFTLAESGRPGPVAIDIPKDVLTAKLAVAHWPAVGRGLPTPPPLESPHFARAAQPSSDDQIAALARHLTAAERPVLYLGGGIIASNAAPLARELAHRLSAPVVSTLMALGAMPADDPLFMGMLGMHGTKATHVLLDEADLVLAIGARFDDRATGKVAEFCPHAAIAHIDIDPAEIGKIKNPFLGLVGDAAEILRRLLAILPPVGRISGPPRSSCHCEEQRDQAIHPNRHGALRAPCDGTAHSSATPRSAWRARAAALRTAHPLAHPPRDEDPLHPINLIRFLAETLPADTIVATDVGQHQMWVAQAWPFRAPRTLLTSGGLGTMGFGLPAAIGAAIALREIEGTIGATLALAETSGASKNHFHVLRENGSGAAAATFSGPNHSGRVVCVSGDGSILMNIQELATLAELDLPVAVFIFNNGHLGLVRQQQELFYRENYAASRFAAAPDFAALARAFGIRGIRLDPAEDPHTVLAASLLEPGPCVIDIPIREMTNVYPMVPPGAANRHTICEPTSIPA